MHNYLILILMLIIILVAGACGGVGEPEELPPALTLTPAPTADVQGTCDQRGLLEQWLQVVDYQVAEFAAVVEQVEGQSVSQLYSEARALNALQLYIAGLPVPECAVETRELVVEAIGRFLDEMVAVVNGQQHDIRPAAETAQEALTRIREQLDVLIGIMDQVNSGS
ncbi:MAG: hypothetical protein ACOCX3_03215 [Chloroflexota bacterium]